MIETNELPPLSRREARFLDLYMTGMTGAAVMREMRSKGTSQQLADRAYKMANRPNVRKHIAHRRSADAEIAGIRKERMLRRMDAIASGSLQDLYDENGNLIPIHLLPERVAMSIAAIEVEDVFTGEGADRKVTSRILKYKVHDPKGAAEVVNRSMGWNRDKLELDTNAAPPVIHLLPYPDADDAERAARDSVPRK